MSEELNAVSYSVGMSIAGSLIQQGLNDIPLDVFMQALEDVFKKKETKYSPDEANAIIQKYMEKTTMKQYEMNRVAGESFLSENFKKPGVKTTLSGLQYEVIKEGKGEEHPSPSSTVTVNYEGTLIDGTVFDSSIKRGTPATFGVSQVIPGWTEALQLMKKGSKYRLYIPQELAYGPNQPGGVIQPYMALIFDVELIEIN